MTAPIRASGLRRNGKTASCNCKNANTESHGSCAVQLCQLTCVRLCEQVIRSEQQNFNARGKSRIIYRFPARQQDVGLHEGTTLLDRTERTLWARFAQKLVNKSIGVRKSRNKLKAPPSALHQTLPSARMHTQHTHTRTHEHTHTPSHAHTRTRTHTHTHTRTYARTHTHTHTQQKKTCRQATGSNRLRG